MPKCLSVCGILYAKTMVAIGIEMYFALHLLCAKGVGVHDAVGVGHEIVVQGVNEKCRRSVFRHLQMLSEVDVT